MALKTYKPATPGLRQLVLVDREGVWKGKPVKGLTVGKIGSGARNNAGRITVRFRGGGHKRALRLVDFKRLKRDAPATVERIEYDPNRTAFLARQVFRRGAELYSCAAALGAGRQRGRGRERRREARQRDAAREYSGRHHCP